MTEMTKSMAVFTGSVNPSLADQVATELGTTLGNVKLEKFANGEIYARYLDSVRGADVFIIQSIAGEHINDALMEMLIMIDAAKRAKRPHHFCRRHALRLLSPGAQGRSSRAPSRQSS